MRTHTETGIDLAKAGKLAELRAKTDRDLAFLLQRASQRGFLLVQQNDCEEAEAVYARASAVLPVLKGLEPAGNGLVAQPVARSAAATGRSRLRRARLAS